MVINLLSSLTFLTDILKDILKVKEGRSAISEFI